MTIKSVVPKDLSSWQKKYGPGFVMYSVKTGKVISAADDYRDLVEKSKKKKVKKEEVSVVYLPDAKSISVFPFSL